MEQEITVQDKKGLFIKYPSLVNTCRTKDIEEMIFYNPHFKTKVRYVSYEKLDGANFQVVLTKDGVNYCSRRHLLGLNKDGVLMFKGAHMILDEYQEFFRTLIKEVIVDDKTNEIDKINLNAELFGKGIQNRIDYGEGKFIRFYGMSFNGGNLVDQELFLDTMNEFGYSHFVSPINGIGLTLEEALAIPNDTPSSLSPTGSIREGNVIHPMTNSLMGNDKYFILKDKNAKFKEQSKMKKAYSEEELAQMDEETRIRDLFATYLTENRLDSVISKEVDEPAQKTIGKFIKLTMNDAIEDITKDHKELLEVKNLTKIVSKCGHIVANMILNRI